MKNSIALAAVVAVSLASVGHASPFTITYGVGGTPNVPGAALETLNGLNPAYLTLGSDAHLVTGANYGVAYVPPFYSGATAAYFGESPNNGLDQSQYLAIFRNGSAAFEFPSEQQYFGLLWASIDEGNYLAFYDNQDNLIGTITGYDFPAGIRHDVGLQGTLYVNIVSTVPFMKVVANSTAYSFEIDDVAYAAVAPVPEPAGGLLTAAGVLCWGFLRRRKS